MAAAAPPGEFPVEKDRHISHRNSPAEGQMTSGLMSRMSGGSADQALAWLNQHIDSSGNIQ
jgi:hypothetical protein